MFEDVLATEIYSTLTTLRISLRHRFTHTQCQSQTHSFTPRPLPLLEN